MRNQGIGSLPRRRARRTPDRVAILHQDTTLTYRQLDERVTRLAHALRALGVEPGDRVAYLGPNHPAFLESLFATATLGAGFVPLNTRLAAAEIEYLLADSGAAVLVFGPECETIVKGLAGELTATPLALGTGYETALAVASRQPIDEPVDLDGLCMIMYTSGTTGRPKGATLTHGNVTWNCLNVLVDLDLAASEVTLVTAPMFHTAALNMTCLPTLLKGGQLVIEPGFDPERVLELIERRRVTCLFGVPAMYAALAESPRWATADLASLRTVLCGAAPVPESLIHTYLDRGLAFVQGYGMTETAPGVLCLDRETSAGATKVRSAGVPHFFTDVRVVAPDGTDAAPGERGEILVRGPNVMPGYWRQPEATAAAFTDGDWFRSGDVAVLDEDGYAYIVDRLKDVIISGGENIYPAEVENALYGHPDVAECAVIGVPDAIWGEVGRAIVAPRARRHPRRGRAARLRRRPTGPVQGAEDRRARRRAAPQRHRKGPQIPAAHALRHRTRRCLVTTIVNGLPELKTLVGQHLGHSPWFEIDQNRINTFADATNDHQWIHVDVERAKAGPFGGPIAHGYLTLALIIPLWEQLLTVDGVTTKVNYGLNKVRFPAPVPVDAKVRVGATLVSVEDLAGNGVQVVIDFVVERDGGDKPCCVAQAVHRYYA